MIYEEIRHAALCNVRFWPPKKKSIQTCKESLRAVIYIKTVSFFQKRVDQVIHERRSLPPANFRTRVMEMWGGRLTLSTANGGAYFRCYDVVSCTLTTRRHFFANVEMTGRKRVDLRPLIGQEGAIAGFREGDIAECAMSVNDACIFSM